MDHVDVFFDDCFEDRIDAVTGQIEDEPSLIQSRRIGGRTPLHQAAFGGAEHVVALLIKLGADVNATSEYGWVPLHYAAAPSSSVVTELLVRGGATVNVPNSDGRTPLHHAADFGKEAMVGLLLLRGADPNARDNEGRSPLDYADPDSGIARLLESRGAERSGTAVSQPDASAPDWLKGYEGLVQDLLNKADEQWNVPGRKDTGPDAASS